MCWKLFRGEREKGEEFRGLRVPTQKTALVTTPALLKQFCLQKRLYKLRESPTELLQSFRGREKGREELVSGLAKTFTATAHLLPPESSSSDSNPSNGFIYHFSRYQRLSLSYRPHFLDPSTDSNLPFSPPLLTTRSPHSPGLVATTFSS